jgi:hypothetical protein
MAKTVAELLVDVLVDAGVERIYGVPGDSLPRSRRRDCCTDSEPSGSSQITSVSRSISTIH